MQSYKKTYPQGTLFDRMALRAEVVKDFFKIEEKPQDETLG